MTARESTTDEVPTDDAGPLAEVPLCLRCARPVTPTTTRCPHCDEPIGSSTVMPYEMIHAEWTFFDRAARRLTRHHRLLLVALLAGLVFVHCYGMLPPAKPAGP